MQLFLQTIQKLKLESTRTYFLIFVMVVGVAIRITIFIILPAVHGENNAGVHHRPKYCGGEEVSQEGTGESTSDRHQPVPEAVLLLELPPQLQ